MSNNMTEAKLDKLIPALIKAQGVLAHAKKDAANPAFKRNGKDSMYADLADVLDACKPALQANGFAVTHQREVDANLNEYLVTTLWHESGQSLSSKSLLCPANKTPQGIGGAITYFRRYDLSALIGLASEDDDGNDASGIKPQQQTTGNAQSQVPSVQASPVSSDALIDFMTLVAQATQATGLNDFEQKFVTDMQQRISQYGDNARLPTEKQMQVLQKCADKAQPLAITPSDDDIPDYMKDSIPF